MNELIESGDPRAKVVGKRRLRQPGSESLAAGGQMNRLAAQLRQRPLRVKHGVYRFHSHEDADTWMLEIQVR